MPKKRKPKVASAGDTPLTPITAKERKELDKSIKKKYGRFRKRCPEVHGRVVDFITHSIEDGTLYFSVRFKDKTDFSLRYACDMFVVGADFCDFRGRGFTACAPIEENYHNRCRLHFGSRLPFTGGIRK
jgi:hypothetical protein